MIMGFPLTAVVLTRNEESNIACCLRSLEWCDERVIVDDNSSDRTCEIAGELGARILHRGFDTFAGQRNWALEFGNLKHDWVLMLDADERATPELQKEIEQRLPGTAPDVVGFRMCRKTMFLGRWLKRSDGFPVWIMRLVRKGQIEFEDQGHGEVPIPQTSGRLESIQTPFLHEPFSHGISQWVSRHNRYSTREAELEHSDSVHWNARELISRDPAAERALSAATHRRLPCRPVLRFLYQYLWKGGIWEGRSGLAFSFLMSVYEGLTVLKRWELEEQSRIKSTP